MEKDKRVVSLEKQLREEKVARNRAEKERKELRTSWMQNNTKFETLKADFNYCQERVEQQTFQWLIQLCMLKCRS